MGKLGSTVTGQTVAGKIRIDCHRANCRRKNTDWLSQGKLSQEKYGLTVTGKREASITHPINYHTEHRDQLSLGRNGSTVTSKIGITVIRKRGTTATEETGINCHKENISARISETAARRAKISSISTLWGRKRVYVQLLALWPMAMFHAQIWQFWKTARISETTAHILKISSISTPGVKREYMWNFGHLVPCLMPN